MGGNAVFDSYPCLFVSNLVLCHPRSKDHASSIQIMERKAEVTAKKIASEVVKVHEEKIEARMVEMEEVVEKTEEKVSFTLQGRG